MIPVALYRQHCLEKKREGEGGLQTMTGTSIIRPGSPAETTQAACRRTLCTVTMIAGSDHMLAANDFMYHSTVPSSSLG